MPRFAVCRGAFCILALTYMISMFDEGKILRHRYPWIPCALFSLHQRNSTIVSPRRMVDSETLSAKWRCRYVMYFPRRLTLPLIPLTLKATLRADPMHPLVTMYGKPRTHCPFSGYCSSPSRLFRAPSAQVLRIGLRHPLIAAALGP